MPDPGFPFGGYQPVGGEGGALTSDAGTFWQKRMQNRKNWVPSGGLGLRGAWIRLLFFTVYSIIVHFSKTHKLKLRFLSTSASTMIGTLTGCVIF